MSRRANDGKGHLGGRKKGVPNKKTQSLLEKAQSLEVDPFEILLLFAKGDWRGLGYKEATITQLTRAGDPIKIDVISPEMRLSAAEKACQYLFPKRKAIDVTSDEKPIGPQVFLNIPSNRTFTAPRAARKMRKTALNLRFLAHVR